MTKNNCSLYGCKLTKKETARYCIMNTQDSKGDILICADCLLTKTLFSRAIIKEEKEEILNNWNKHRKT